MNAKLVEPTTPVLAFSRLLRDLDQLMLQGKGNAKEADAVRGQMEAIWGELTEQEQERMDGLSEDLYALAEGGPPRVAMDAEQLAAWRREVAEAMDADPDAALGLLRKPSPDALPRGTVARLQACCWERLGDPATAARFAAKPGPIDGAMTVGIAGSLVESEEHGVN